MQDEFQDDGAWDQQLQDERRQMENAELTNDDGYSEFLRTTRGTNHGL